MRSNTEADLDAIYTALVKFQRYSLVRAVTGRDTSRDVYLTDAAILALERIRTHIANSVPAEQAAMFGDAE